MGLKTPPEYLENSNPFILDHLAGVNAAQQSFGILEMNFPSNIDAERFLCFRVSGFAALQPFLLITLQLKWI